jgi:hypothetical protein
MSDKLTPQQAAQLAVLETFPPRFEQAHRLIEELAAQRTDPSLVARLCRVLEQAKAAANSIGETAMAETLGTMATLARRMGDQQMKVRGLREGLTGLKLNYSAAVRALRGG